MKRYGFRYFWFFAGVLINSFGVAFITKASLGTSPISSVPYMLSFQFPLTLGQFTFLLNSLFLLLQIALLGRKFPPLQLLQLAATAVFSGFLDVSMALLSWLQPAGLAEKLVSLLAGCAVLALGIAIEVAPDILVVPGEGIVRAIALVSGKKFGSVKVAFDVALVLIAVALSLLFFHRLRGMGAGTVISALLVGRLVNLYNRRLPLLARISALRQPA